MLGEASRLQRFLNLDTRSGGTDFPTRIQHYTATDRDPSRTMDAHKTRRA